MNYFNPVLPRDTMEEYGDPRLMIWGLIASLGFVLDYSGDAPSLEPWTSFTDDQLKASISFNKESEA